MLPHLGPKLAAECIAEMLRVAEEGSKVRLFPARPFKLVAASFTVKKRYSFRAVYPTLVITKPAGFDGWSDNRKAEFCGRAAACVTYGGVMYEFIRLVNSAAIRVMRTHRIQIK